MQGTALHGLKTNNRKSLKGQKKKGKEKIMKKFKKMLALIIAFAMVLGMSATVLAVDISVEQDGSYKGEEGEAGRNYTWYKVFDASYADNFDPDFDGGHTNGVANTEQGEGKASYTATPAVAAKLGTIDAETKAWTTNSGNKWFDLTYVPGSDNYSVTWRSGVTANATTLQAAADWLKTNNVYEKTGSLTWNGTSKKWEATGLDKGYYLIVGDSGANLVLATTDIEIKEKNVYPPVDKTQADEDDNVQTDQDKNVAVGDVLTYNVKVTIPTTAKVGETIVVYDKPSKGLTYNNDIAVKTNEANASCAAGTAGTGEAWRWVITITENTVKGKDVVFECTMTVNEDALEDPDKENPAGLVYNEYESKPDKVKFKTYFAGIHKIDGDTEEDLSGVKFALFEDGVAFNVKLVDGVYIPDTSESGKNEVVTDADGLIRIRGLDDDKTYTLTETEALPGYNPLSNDITLTLHEDTYTVTTTDGEEEVTSSFDGATDDEWGEVENNKGTVLPSTGGIGTTIFYVMGAILVLGAGVILVTRRRMNTQ
jgi:fimbrial isopeptide formation D2 family protein/LPXTG-motif cell wall-anchored protein